MKAHKNKELRTRADEAFFKEYKSFCKKNSLVFSKRLRALLEMDLRGKIKG
jgi:hypothetical protein